MLTAKQYEAIGRLALAFNGIEHMLDMYLPDILGSPEPSAAFLVADIENSATRKMEFLRKLLQAILSDRPSAQLEIEVVLNLLKEAKLLSERRNDYVHSFAFIDFKTRKRKLRTKTGVIECKEHDIMALADEAEKITVRLSQALYKLQTVLIKVRYAR